MSFWRGLGKLTVGIVALPVTLVVDSVTCGAEMFLRDSEEPLVVSSLKKIGDGFDEILEGEEE